MSRSVLTEPMPKHRYAARAAAPTSTSLVEVTAYALLGSVVAAAILVASGQPGWQAAVVVALALGPFAISIVVSRRRPARHTRSRRG